MPGTLFAVMETPIPVPQSKDPFIMFALRNRLSDRERNVWIQNGFVIKDAIIVRWYSTMF